MSTCRFCGDSDGRLIKYGTRHYAHPHCGLEKFGAKFFDRLGKCELENFPYLPAFRVGLGDELVRRIKEAK